MLLIKQNIIENCPVCGSLLIDPCSQIVVTDPFQIIKSKFIYSQCFKCKAWILNPRPDISEMWRFYNTDFLFNPTENKNGLISKIASNIQEFNLISEVNFVLKYLKSKKSYLDYSAGNGQILNSIRKKYPQGDFFATEFSIVYQNYLKGLIGFENTKEMISEFPEAQKFDVISAFGVLEHVEDPKGLIMSLSERLSIDGVLIITVPNVNSLQQFIFGKKWYSWLAPRHWQMFNLENLENLLRSENLVIIKRKGFFLRTNSSSFVLSLFPSIDPLINRSTIKLLFYGFLFYLFIPLELIISLFLKRSSFIGLVLKNNNKNDHLT